MQPVVASSTGAKQLILRDHDDERHSAEILYYEQILTVVILHRNRSSLVDVMMSPDTQQFLAVLTVFQFRFKLCNSYIVS